MNELSDEDVIAALHAEFDRLPLPHSLTTHLGRGSPVTGLAEPETSPAATDRPPRARRRRRVVSIGGIAAAVAAILVGAVIARSGANDPSAGPAGVDSATEFPSVDNLINEQTLPPKSSSGPTSSTSSVVPTVPSYNIPIWLGGFCGRPWPYPAATAPLLVEPTWPKAIRKGGNGIPRIRYRVTNMGTSPIDTSEDYGVMILRGSTVVGFSGHSTLDAHFLVLGAGESTSGTSSIPINLRTCEGQELPAGTYRFIIAKIVGNSRVAFSEPGEVRVLDR